MGISPNIGTYFGQRVIWNSTKKFAQNYDQEFQASKSRYISWFHTSKAFANVYNGRTYAQVASQISNHPWGSSANRDNVKGTRIVTVPQGNANAALVTFSKVSIEPKSSRPVGRAPFIGLKHKLCSQYLGKSAFELSHVPVNNRFQALQNLDENICETQGNAPTVLDEVATASAVTTVQKLWGKPHKASNIQNAFSVDEKSNTLSKLTINGVHVESNIPPVHENRNVGILSQNTLQTDTLQVATLGDGGTCFQPAPESGQACDFALPDPTSSSYVREEKNSIVCLEPERYLQRL